MAAVVERKSRDIQSLALVRMMRFLSHFLIGVFLFMNPLVIFAQEDQWQEYRSDHFIIFHKDAAKEFIDEVSSKAEEYFAKIAETLGFQAYPTWWGDRRVKIYIYSDQPDYYSAVKESGQPIWSAGGAFIEEHAIKTFQNQRNFCDRILPHELTHLLLFREFIGNPRDIPHTSCHSRLSF